MLKLGVLTSRREAPGLDVVLAHHDVACIVSTTARPDDAVTRDLFRAAGVDVVLLLGHRYIVRNPLLSAFPILNIHDSDLRVTRPDGERRYIGLRSTLDAILAGENETRSTLHVVTEKLDGGPIISVSRAYPVAPFVHEAAVAGQHDIVKAYAYAQREWMMRDSWGAMLVEALARWRTEAA
jgi:folate-dependent phosphoribosylglycinamide formyltransferase PurN